VDSWFLPPFSNVLRSTAKAMVTTIALAGGVSAWAHNLDQVNTHLRFDLPTLNLLESRFLQGETLIQEGDQLGLIFKSTPGPGTNIGAGGYFTFYIPEGTQVTGVDYGTLNSSGSFSVQPLKPPATMPLGDGDQGSATTSSLVGLTLGPNITGQTAATVDATGKHRGTLAGIYGDVGLFYSTDPRTAWRTFESSGGFDGNPATQDNELINNNGNAITPSNFWDAAQLMAFGMKHPAAPLMDPNGRGNAPWGLASPVAGPESGYAWCFDLDYWRSHPNHPQRMRKSIRLGPWQRIRYPGSTVAKDQPGLTSLTKGLALQDASDLGIEVHATAPLPPTLSWTDSTSPKAIRIAYGELMLGRSEHGRVRLKVLADAGEPDSPFEPDGSIRFHSDVSGGDAGGTSNGKDHVWRYVKSSPLAVETASHFQKTFVKNIVQVGETSHFDLVIVNTGAGPMHDVVVRDPLPSGLSFVSASEAPVSTNPLRWNVGTLPSQGFRRIRVQYTATSTGTRYNIAQMVWQGGVKEAMDSVDVTTTGSPNPPATLSVGNLLFLDSNYNGRADPGEGLANIPIELYHADDSPGIDSPRATAFTTPDGRYLFTDLEADEYKLHLPALLFQQGQPLTGMFSVRGVGTGDDDLGEDGEDAPEPWITGISTREFHLAEGTAPTQFTFETGSFSSSDDADDSNVDLTIDLGLFFAVGIGNHVFIDANRNGRSDPGEGYDGVTLELYPDGTAPGTHAPLATTTTENGGFYAFYGILPGQYRVHINKEMFTVDTPLYGMVSLPGNIAGDDDVGDDAEAFGDLSQTGVTSSLISVGFGTAPTASTGETGMRSDSDDHIDAIIDLTVDFGFERPLKVGNLVFADLNRNGRSDAGEGLEGIQLQLFRSDQQPLSDLPVAETITDTEGRYEFGFLYPGDYFVFVPPQEFDVGRPLEGHESVPGHATDEDDDLSEDGIDEPLPRFTGVRSHVFTLNPSQAPTDAQYETGAFADSDNLDDANGNLTIDFGFRLLDPLEVGVGNLVFIDQNANGTADAGEGVAGVWIQLFAEGADPLFDSPLSAMMTDADGHYLFRGLTEGAFFVHIPASEFQVGKPLHGYLSIPGAGEDWGLDDDIDENGIDSPEPWLTGIRSSRFYLAPGSEPLNAWGEWGAGFDLDDAADDNSDLTIDFGFTIPVALGNLVFLDANDNGRADPGEGIPGVTIQLYTALAQPQFDTALAETTTDAEGRYLFTDLSAGSYLVHIPHGMFAQGAPLHGRISLPGASTGDDDSSEDGLDDPQAMLFGISSNTVSLSPGQAPAGPNETGFDSTSDDDRDTHTDLTIDFGFAIPATLGSLVFHDLNGDGLHQPDGADGQPFTSDDEVGLANASVEVWHTGSDQLIGGGDDTLVETIETRFDGTGEIEGLSPGTYYLRIPDSAFAPGAALQGFPVSSPVSSALDNQTPGDNNGTQPAGRATAALSPVITLAPGEVDTSIGFGFMATIHPLTWPAWQLRNADLSDTSFSGNSDGDAYSNLLEFAFGLNARTGIATRPPVRIEVDPITQRIDLCVDRVTGTSGLTLGVELISDLATSPGGWMTATDLTPIITPHLDETEEVRYQDIAAHPSLLSANQGFARLILSVDADLNGEPEAIQRTETLGWTRLTLGTYLQTLGYGFAPASRFTAQIDAVSGHALEVATALNGSTPASLLTSGAQHYLEILTGPHAGHRLELNENATASATAALVLDIDDLRSTLTGEPPDTLVGARLALRQHLTLGDIANRTHFTATNNPATADRILLYNSTTAVFQTYWLFAFGGNPRWVLQGDNTLSNQGALIIEPSRALFIHPRTQPVTITLKGQVREHAFAAPLLKGLSLCATGWPMTLSPAGTQMLTSNGFTGSSSAGLADQIQTWRADSQPDAQGYSGLFLLSLGNFQQWTTIGDGTLANQSNAPFLKAHRAVFMRARNAIPNWRPPLPWSP
jgi:uncharacterized repeat protein (TIGR01451 family)